MHNSWLKDKYNSEEKVKALRGITDEQRKVLNGFFVRQGGLADKLSETDLTSIAKAYFGEPLCTLLVHVCINTVEYVVPTTLSPIY